MQSKFIQYKNKKIHYRTGGQGKMVILLHGFAEDGNIWNKILEKLDGYHLIIPDIPGSGQSEMLEGDITINNYADVIKEIVIREAVQVSPMGGDLEGALTLIGHSMGGYITLAFAEKYPESLNSIGLFHSTAYPDTEEKKQIRKKAIEFIKNNGAYTFLRTSIPNLFAGEKHLIEIEKLVEEGRNFSAEALIQYYNAMINRSDRVKVLKDTGNPVLFVMGEKDTTIPMESMLQQCHIPSVSHIHILSESGHMGMIEESEQSGDIISSFLQNI